jgi:LysR substrate binding domain
VFDQTALAIDAALAGQGIALARTALASLDLIAGRLVRPLQEAIPAEYAYWIVCRKSAADAPKISQFRSWLIEQVQDDKAARSQRKVMTEGTITLQQPCQPNQTNSAFTSSAAVCPLPMIRGRANTERRIIMRTLAALLVLVGHCFVSHTAAAQSQDCKLCREDYTACVKAHTQGACKTNYDICMNHCRKK